MDDWSAQIFANSYQRKLFRKDDSVLVAVSGGMDSMVLLHVLNSFREPFGIRLAVAHFNHCLRGRTSQADERFVRAESERLEIPFFSDRGDVKAFAKERKLSIEMAARQLRHQFLARTAVKSKMQLIALGHHADDQVELFFLRLFRGAGPDGLSGMKWKSPSPINPAAFLIRPMLDQPREALLSYAQRTRVSFRNDVSNASLEFQRNRIRHELIPLLKARYQEALPQTTLRVMEIIGGEAELANLLAKNWLRKKRRTRFSQLPIATQRRVLKIQLQGKEVSSEFQLVEFLRLHPNEWSNIDGNRSVSHDGDGNLEVKTAGSGLSVPVRRNQARFSIAAPMGAICFGSLKIQWTVVESPLRTKARELHQECFDAEKVGTVIQLRYWKAGDRFQPIGMSRAVKLQDIFTNMKVPRDERHRKVVAVTERGEVFWVEGLRIGELFKLDKGTLRQLKWSWQSS